MCDRMRPCKQRDADSAIRLELSAEELRPIPQSQDTVWLICTSCTIAEHWSLRFCWNSGSEKALQQVAPWRSITRKSLTNYNMPCSPSGSSNASTFFFYNFPQPSTPIHSKVLGQLPGMGDFFLAANVSSLGNGHMPLFLPLGRKKYALCGVHARVPAAPTLGKAGGCQTRLALCKVPDQPSSGT